MKVYVLVKKPDSIEELTNAIARAPVAPPSKPEVYFIKYKAQSAGGLSQPIGTTIGLSAPSSSIVASPDLSSVLGQSVLTSSIDSTASSQAASVATSSSPSSASLSSAGSTSSR